MTVTRKVRPAEMKGSGSPVIGTMPIDIAMLMKTCAKIKADIRLTRLDRLRRSHNHYKQCHHYPYHTL